MINVSDEFISVMQNESNFLVSASVEFTSGLVLNIPRGRFMMGGNTYTDGAGSSAFPLGEAVCKTMSIEIDNYDGKYDSVDFFGAKITISLSLELSETTESIVLGQYTVVNPTTQGETIIITAADEMYKADKDFHTSLAFPCTLSELFVDACASCGVAYKTATFNNSDFEVKSRPAKEYTFRQIFGFIAALAGGNARINHDNYLEIIPYKFAENALSANHSFYNWINLTVETSDVIITGVQTNRTITTTDAEGNLTQAEETIINGAEGYVISVDNPLIADNEEVALQLIGSAIANKSFRVFSGEYPAYPLAEFMDTVSITDRKGKTYLSFITDMDFTFGGATSFSNNAEPALRNENTYQGSGTKAIIEARKLVEQEKAAREAATDALSQRIATSSGMYSTDEKQSDGSIIRYLHNRPTLAESANVIKVTSEVIGFSTDGGKTYPYGITLDGQTIMQLISAEGINFTWAVGVLMRLGGLNNASGKLQVYDGNNGLISQVDKDGYNSFGTDDNGNKTRSLLNDACLQFGINDTDLNGNPIDPIFSMYADFNDPITGKDTLIQQIPSDGEYVIRDENSITRFGVYSDGSSQLKNRDETAKFNVSADGQSGAFGKTVYIRSFNGEKYADNYAFADFEGFKIQEGAETRTIYHDGSIVALENGGTGANTKAQALKNLGFEIATGQGTLNSDGSYKTFYFSNVNGSGTSFSKSPVVTCSYGVNGSTLESGDFPVIKIKNVGVSSFQAAYGGSSTGIAYPIFYQAIAIQKEVLNGK